MFAVKPRIEIVFRILMAAAILLSAPLNVFSVKADDVTVTPTQVSSATPTAEPTVTPTDTPAPPVAETPMPDTEMTGPSATPAPVETLPPTEPPITEPSAATAAAPGEAQVHAAQALLLTLSSNPDFISNGGIFTLNWSIEGIDPAGLVLQILLPASVSPHGKSEGTYDETTHSLSLVLTASAGNLQLEANDAGSGVNIEAALIGSDEVLTTASLFLPSHEQFVLDQKGGEIKTSDGKVSLVFPAGTLPEEAVINIGSPTRVTMPPDTLTGRPIEITTHGKQSGTELRHFSKELWIVISYADLDIRDEVAAGLRLNWYDTETSEWIPISSMVDTQKKTVIAAVDHFTVFDMDTNNWQASHLPTVESFQTAAFTGAATDSYPIQVPPGPGGLQPSLSLNYNSQVVDQSTTASQASWVGMGWSLDTGTIEMNVMGTDTWTGDDTFTLSVAGVSSQIIQDGSGVYHMADEAFWKINYDAANKVWTAKDKVGNTYTFAHKSYYAYQIGSCPNAGVGWQVYRWSLTKMENVFGQSIIYEYADDIKSVDLWSSSGGTCHIETWTASSATYPSAITYANGKYRILFDRQPNRWDYPILWTTDVAHHEFEKQRLENIYVQQDANGDGNFETIIRSYHLTYAPDGEVIFPGYTATAGGKTLTLKSVQEYGLGGIGTPLPAVTFTYGDHLHLTRADNGYGGAIEFQYESTPWYYPARGRESHSLGTNFGGSGDTCSTSSPSPWVARPSAYISCDGSKLNVRDGSVTTPDMQSPGATFNSGKHSKDWVRPGGVYKLTASVAIGAFFTDVPVGNWAKTQIEGLSVRGILNPCSTTPLKFCPGNNVPRANVAVELLRAKYGSGYVPPTPSSQRFSDVSSGPPPYWGYAWIDKFAADGYTAGCGGGKFCPNDNVTRIDMGIFLLRGKYGGGYTPPPVTVHYFTDMIGNGLEAWANKAYLDGIISGCGGGKFCPSTAITRDQEAVMIENTYHLVGNPVPNIRIGMHDGTTDNLGTMSSNTYYVPLPVTASKAEPLIEVTNTPAPGLVTWFGFELLTSIYRVQAKRVFDGLHQPYTTIYSYSDSSGDTAKVNDRTLSPNSTCDFGDTSCYAYSEAHSEFRGNGLVTETKPDGTKTITMFAQDDFSKGKPVYVIQNDGSGDLSRVDYQYGYAALSIKTYTACSGCPAYKGVSRTWVHTNYETTTIYGTGGGSTRVYTTYDLNNPPNYSYGNALTTTDQILNGSTWTTYRSTEYTYIYKDTSDTYLVSLPARIKTYNSGNGPLAITINLYDGNAGVYDNSTTLTKGILTSVRTLIQNSNDYSQVSYAYDHWGNRISETTYDSYGHWDSAPPSGARTTYTCYGSDPGVSGSGTVGGDTCAVDAYHAYPLWIKNALAQKTNITYDYTKGVPIQETDPNGNSTSAEYDGFGRITKVIRPGDDSAHPTISMAYADGNPFTTTLTQKIDGAQTYSVTRTYDGLGRQTKITSGGVIVDTIYDSVTVTKQSVPYQGTSPNLFTITTINPAAHTARVDSPDGSYTLTTTSGLQTTVRDASGNNTVSLNDLWGRLFSVTPPSGPSLNYTYDELNRVIFVRQIGQSGTNTTTFTYDNAGRKIQMIDPDMGTWNYNYDALSNLKTQTDARGCVLTMGYDNLSRLTSKSSSGSCGTQVSTGYTYDSGTSGKGRRTGMTDASGSSAWTYDTRGRLATESKVITSAGTFKTSWGYNSADLMTSMTYPGGTAGQAGEVVTLGYNSRMLLNSVIGASSYVSSTSYDPAGRIDVRTFGNGTKTDYDYYAWNTASQGGRLQYLKSGTTGSLTSLQNLSYTYDAGGNISQIINTGATETQAYGYDALNRLTSWTLNNGTPETYAYNASSGNQTSKGSLSYTYSAQVSCPAGNRTIPHAVSAASPYTFSYDCDGNQTVQTGNGQTFNYSYDAENRMVSVSGTATASFVYDGDGNRVRATVNGTTTTFVGTYYELTGSTVTKYYMAGAQRVAMRKYTVPQSMSLEYLLGDHLGSASITTDTSGAKVSEMRYKPWGEVRYSWTSGVVSTPAYKLSSYTFTGQYSYMDDPTTSGVMEGFGLMFYNARFYSPYINHFTQPDTIIPDQTSPQSWDRYSYVSNNPLRYTDPTGHQLCGDGENVNCSGGLSTPTGNAGNCSGDNCGGVNGRKDKEDETVHLSTQVTLGLPLGSTSNVPDYYGDYQYNTNVPYFPGGNVEPNPCFGPGAPICLVSFFVSLIPPAENPGNPANNFFLTFNMAYDEGIGVTVSNFQWSNSYNGPVVFNNIRINNLTVPVKEGSYLPHDGLYHSIDYGGGSSTTGIIIEAKIFTVINTPNGAGQWPYPLSYTVPPLP